MPVIWPDLKHAWQRCLRFFTNTLSLVSASRLGPRAGEPKPVSERHAAAPYPAALSPCKADGQRVEPVSRRLRARLWPRRCSGGLQRRWTLVWWQRRPGLQNGDEAACANAAVSAERASRRLALSLPAVPRAALTGMRSLLYRSMTHSANVDPPSDRL